MIGAQIAMDFDSAAFRQPKSADSPTSQQAREILRHLKGGNSITPLEALHAFGCLRLGARIFDLRELGYRIVTEWETDGAKRWARYRLAP